MGWLDVREAPQGHVAALASLRREVPKLVHTGSTTPLYREVEEFIERMATVDPNRIKLGNGKLAPPPQILGLSLGENLYWWHEAPCGVGMG
jgi:hypothetical protein